MLFQNTTRNNGPLAMIWPSLWQWKQSLFPSKFRKDLIHAQELLDDVSLSLIRKRKQQRDAEIQQHSEQEIQRVPNDFLDLLIDARDKDTGEPLSEEEVRALDLLSH